MATTGLEINSGLPLVTTVGFNPILMFNRYITVAFYLYSILRDYLYKITFFCTKHDVMMFDGVYLAP